MVAATFLAPHPAGFPGVLLNIPLPVGISFYAFESLSYVIDVYRKRIEVSKSLLDYGLYVTFFPHLVAGPILRYGDFSPQCLEPKSWQSAPVGRGLTLLVFGLALKVCLADLVFAPVVDRVFAVGAEPGFAESWLGGAAFSLQVLCDFGGYSLCAIGTALMSMVLTNQFNHSESISAANRLARIKQDAAQHGVAVDPSAIPQRTIDADFAVNQLHDLSHAYTTILTIAVGLVAATLIPAAFLPKTPPD